MAKRVNINGTYMLQRERNTSAGAKGTFIGKWSSSSSSSSAKSIVSKATRETHLEYKKAFRWLANNDS